MPGRRARGKAAGMTLADLTEEQLLARMKAAAAAKKDPKA